MTPIIDCHVHTRYSDGTGEVADVVAAAKDAGCAVLALTDHLTLPHEMDPTCECSVAEKDLTSRASDITAAARVSRESGGPEIVAGFECDWYEGCEDNVRAWSEGTTFRLGAIHWAAGGWIDDPDDLHVWEQLGPDEVWRRYVDAWCAACESELSFDSMAHPDLVRRFENEGYRATIGLGPLWGRMAECAHDTGVHVEVSTAGLRKSVDGYYPTPELLLAFRHAEVPITVGSDAHRPQDVCWGIRDAYAYAAGAGYTSVDAPRAEGGWQTFAL